MAVNEWVDPGWVNAGWLVAVGATSSIRIGSHEWGPRIDAKKSMDQAALVPRVKGSSKIDPR